MKQGAMDKSFLLDTVRHISRLDNFQLQSIHGLLCPARSYDEAMSGGGEPAANTFGFSRCYDLLPAILMLA
jgi:hypothetical protein